MAARHIPYPKASSSATGPSNSSSSGHRPPPSASPHDAPRRPSSSLSDLKNSKKRPKAPASRGSSPPDKRVRSGAYDTNAARSPTFFASPMTSRNNSITSLNSGPSSAIQSGRKKHSTDVASPLQRTNSPLSFQHGESGSSRSEDSAPFRAAPTAPSMIPGTPPYTNNTSGTINSVRALKARKQAQAARAAQAAVQARSPSNAASDNASAGAIHNTTPTITPHATPPELMDGMASVSRNEIDDLKNTVKALKDEVQRLRSKEAEPQADIREELEDLRSKVNRIDTREELTHNKLMDLSDNPHRRLAVQAIINDVKQFIGPIEDEYDRTKNTLLGRMCDMEEKYGRLTKQLNKLEPLGGQISTVLSGQARTGNSVASFKDAQADIEKNVSSAMHKISLVEAKVTAYDIRMTALDAKVKDAGNKLSSFDKKVNGEWDSKILSLDKKVNENDGRISALDIKFKENASTVLALGDKVKQNDSKVSALDIKAKENNGKISTLDAKVKEHNSKISALDSKVKVDNSKTLSLDSVANGELVSKISSLDTANKENGNKLSSLEATVQGVMSSMVSRDAVEKLSSDTTKKIGTLDASVKAHQKWLTSLENTHHIINTFSEETMDKLSAVDSQINNHGRRISSLEASRADIQKSFSETADKYKHDADHNGKQLSAFDDRINEIQAQVRQAAIKSTQATPSPDAQLNQQVKNVSTSVTQVESRVDQLEQKQTAIIEDLKIKHENAIVIDKDLKAVEKQVHDFANIRQALETEVPNLTIRRVMGQVEAQVKRAVEDLKALNSVNNPGSIPTDVKEQIDNIDTTLRDHEEMIRNVTSRVSSVDEKSENSFRVMSTQVRDAEHKSNILTFSVQSLEKRYENITTDKLHQQMVHWITQNYPHAPDFLNQLRVLQRQVEGYAVTEGNLTGLLNNHELQGQRIAKVEEDIKSLTSLPFDQVKQYCGSQPQVFAEIFQLRANIEAINKRLPGGSLRLDWNIDFSKPPSPPHQDEMQG
ncbi:hypothetical protein DM02DRAFT_625451 [Periconia macrospinosa]|uniref:Uncharacterized protein n=1 Tax=Periconia macrospinosa TaxID=97972 RepID=A0A2V1E090_9PLEO|nr:hypothetical protein DM02DRAFT_625451 [Periconia macrospinosa]